MIRAAGILYLSAAGHVLLAHRTDGQGWAFPGGGIEDGESAEDAARREFFEETGEKFEGSLVLWTRRVSPVAGAIPNTAEGVPSAVGEEVDFTTFLAKGEEFAPKLNDEHDRWMWCDRDFALASPGLHPGCYVALRRFGMHELDLAKAIVSGELTSPQRYENLLLVAIRITGTGVAYRGSHDEFPWRDSALYLTDEFLARCNGLPVILEHPKKNVLNTKEFKDRIVGTVFLPYIQGDEVWSVAKIWDEEVSNMLETQQMSTSPGIVCGGTKFKMRDGTKLLIEDMPSLVDHIALLYAESDPDGNGDSGKSGEGVWDKGAGMSGVESIDAVLVADSASKTPDALDVILRTLKVDQIDRLASRL
jgi:8-oxo-dGTP pyrophosphatase MutT (NUDIX family)